MKKAEMRRALMELINIHGPSGEEQKVAAYIRQRLRAAGLPGNAVFFDNAGRRIPVPTACGNLIVHIGGEGRLARQPRRLFVAHMDTVDLAAGTIPKILGSRVLPSKGRALGADDRSGVAVVLLMLLRLLKEQPAHPPITALFTVREETGLWGARCVNMRGLRKPALGFSYDGGKIAEVLVGAPGSDRMDITVTGAASHAGGAPEKGVSAAVIAALAIAELHRKRLHGLVRTGRDRATSNIGTLDGGIFHNIVCPQVEIVAEARAYRVRTLERVVAGYRREFERAAQRVGSAKSKRGSIKFRRHRLYEPFVLAASEPVVRLALRVLTERGLEPSTGWCPGGLDANWLVRHGVPTVTLGAGAYQPHGVHEVLMLDEFEQAADAAYALATSSQYAGA